jgi:alkylation response protein AidB-like acyl-CoA dehydrogenase
MIATVQTQLLETARKLESVILDHADDAERGRRVSPAVLDAMREAGLLRLFVPRSLGGQEIDPVTCARVIEEVARIDSTAGWALTNTNSLDWWLARLPDEGVEEIYAEGPDVIIAAAFHPPMQAWPSEGGYRLTGRTPLASHVHDSTWLMVTALIMEGDEPRLVDGVPQAIGLFSRTDDVEIIDTWYTLGMRGTDSNDVAVDDLYVPATRTFAMMPDFQPSRYHDAPLYRYPGIGEAVAVVCPVALACARGAIDEIRDLAGKKTPFGANSVLSQRTSTHAKLARGEAILRSARALFYGTLSEAWERTLRGEKHTLEQKADLLLAGTHVTASAVEATDLMYGLAGTSAIYTRSRIERHFRDVQTLRHHGFASESRYEAVGQIYVGAEPEFGMVAF